MSSVDVHFDTAKGAAFAERMMELLNGGFLGFLVSIGHRTGLFDTLAEVGPAQSTAVAASAGLDERYVREWLGAMVVGRIVEFEPGDRTYCLPAEHGAFLTRAAGSDNLAFFTQYLRMLGAVESDVVSCFRNGGGVGYECYPEFQQVQAEDAVQDAFLIALTRIGEIRNPAAVKQWLYQVVSNVCFMYRRRSRREVVLPALPEDEDRALHRAPLRPEDYVERLATKDLVWRTVAELSDPLGSTLMLRYFSEFRTYNEIAVILGVPVGTVRSRLAVARRKLLAGLQQETPRDAGTGSIALNPGNLRELWPRLWEDTSTLLPEFFDKHLELVFVHPHEEIARLGRGNRRESARRRQNPEHAGLPDGEGFVIADRERPAVSCILITDAITDSRDEY